MKDIFVPEEINTSRQFEFDIAKVFCIIIMVFVHCFEHLVYFSDHLSTHPLYYAVDIVLDSLFCAGTFMGCMALGMVYCKHKEPENFIKRGLHLFCSGYLLNILRGTIPYILLCCLGLMDRMELIYMAIVSDILQFAGLAFILLGCLNKLKCSDWTIFFISLGMSIVGSLVRHVDFGNSVINQLTGLFIGTYDVQHETPTACFPLLNWFFIVVICYLFAKKLRHCANTDRLYKITLPVSGVILGLYMAYAIPNQYGLLSGDITNYYFVTTPNALMIILGFVFAASVYHFAAKLISDKAKAVIIRISNNLTPIYYLQWIIISGILYTAAAIIGVKDVSAAAVVITAVVVCVISITLGVRCPKKIKEIIS